MTDPMEMSEADLQRLIIDTAEMAGWLVYHVGRSDMGRVTSAGFPDLVLVRPPELMFLELKSRTGRVSPAQTEWLDKLGVVDQLTVRLIRPAQVDAVIRRLLSRPEKGDPHEAAQAVDDFHSER